MLQGRSQTVFAILLIVLALVSMGVFSSQTQVKVVTKKVGATSDKVNSAKNKVDQIRELIALSQQEIIEDILKDKSSATSVIRAVMDFVHDNSDHEMDKEYYSYFGNYLKYYEMLLAVHRGESDHKVHLSCGPRSLLMIQLLERFNIYGRVIQIYSDNFDDVEGHRLVEVNNPETGNWELWDPDTNLVFTDKKSGKRIGVMQAISGDIEQVVPVGDNDKGWDNIRAAQRKKTYFKSVLFESNQTGQRDGTIIINTNRFDLSKTFSGGISFEKWLRQKYGNPRIIKVPL